jgi:hypothetical protein
MDVSSNDETQIPANATKLAADSEPGLWQISAGMGYNQTSEAASGEGKAATARIALGFNPVHWRDLTFGVELGVQKGEEFSVAMTKQQTAELGGQQLQSHIRPISDLLLTLQVPLNSSKTISLIMKGGVAYRQWHFDQYSDFANKLQFNGELQAGLGVKISSRTKLVVYYQGIYSNGSAGLNTIEGQRRLQNIPTQNSGFLSIVMDL